MTVPPARAPPLSYVPENDAPDPGPKGSDCWAVSSAPGAALPGRPPRSTVNDTAVAPPLRSETATSVLPLVEATETVPLEEKATAGDQPSR
ncbi:MAG: hypothetical protein BWX69_03265 [Planctomycetes bacterium ADurb.Bin069]|nr:MAG: hypothetical protein BWX69_03265 [Planctomycetes bacterium ADurb.Bin069]